MSRYRDDREDDFYESRRGRVRSYAEQQFEDAQRQAQDRQRSTENRPQFDYDSTEPGQRERDARRSSGMGTHSAANNLRDEYHRGDSPTRFDEDDYGRGRAIYETTREMDDRDRRRDYSGTRFDAYAGEDRDTSRGARLGGRDSAQDARGETRTEQRTEQPRVGASRSHVRCRDIMTRDVTVAMRDTTLQQVAILMRDEDTGVIPVVELDNSPTNAPNTSAPTPPATTSENAEAGETHLKSSTSRRESLTNGKLIGLITDRDIVVRAIVDGKDAKTTAVEEVMTTDVHTAEPNDRVIDVIRKMGDKQVRRIPVVDREGHLRGIISMADVALETEEDKELAAALEEISSGSSFWNKVFG
ncbi:MAG: CBS domain-containing protein [Pyrinomonadaceae bacterium MAG19_C2-C3]|nr:CBS domain-containing protein [Pyrinomonadaceae bacterium MAG19_C2-C3]